MVNNPDYQQTHVDAVKAEMAGVFRALAEYHDHILLVGGWVPGLLMPAASEPHVGSLDVDIALSTDMGDEFYAQIREIMEKQGYAEDPRHRFRFGKTIAVGESDFAVYVDLLAAEYGGRGRKHEHQHVQDLEPRKTRGCDLAMQAPVSIQAEMRLPNGARTMVALRVAGVASFIVMKGFALAGRRKDKDAYDVVYTLRHYPGGVEAVVADFRQFEGHGLVKEAMGNLEDRFMSAEHDGPAACADFLQLPPGEDRDLTLREATELVQELVRRVRSL